MKSTYYAAATLLSATLLLACPALAQTQESTERGTAAPSGSTDYDTGFEDGRRAAMSHMGAMTRPRAEGSGQEMTEHKGSMSGMMEHMGGMHRMAGHEDAGNGPRVTILRGNAKIILKCSASDSTKDCVSAAIILLNHTAEKCETEKAKAPQEPQPAPAPAPPASEPQAPHTH
jgi:hypothetical protein